MMVQPMTIAVAQTRSDFRLVGAVSFAHLLSHFYKFYKMKTNNTSMYTQFQYTLKTLKYYPKIQGVCV